MSPWFASKTCGSWRTSAAVLYGRVNPYLVILSHLLAHKQEHASRRCNLVDKTTCTGSSDHAMYKIHDRPVVRPAWRMNAYTTPTQNSW